MPPCILTTAPLLATAPVCRPDDEFMRRHVCLFTRHQSFPFSIDFLFLHLSSTLLTPSILPSLPSFFPPSFPPLLPRFLPPFIRSSGLLTSYHFVVDHFVLSLFLPCFLHLSISAYPTHPLIHASIRASTYLYIHTYLPCIALYCIFLFR